MGKRAGTDAHVLLDGNLIGTGPGRYKLEKGQILPGSVIEIESSRGDLLLDTIELKAHPVYLTGDFLLLGLGLLVDVPTGNIYRPKPRKFFTGNEKE